MNSTQVLNDIGLIRVSKSIEFNERVNKVALQTEFFDEVGVSANLTGWGDVKVKLLCLRDKIII